jgi:hypothetical protein
MNPSSRMSYDLGGASMGAQNVNADEVLDEVLRKIYEVCTMAQPDSSKDQKELRTDLVQHCPYRLKSKRVESI